MKVTHVSIAPSARAAAARCPALSPELLASVGARYSRNNSGLEAILPLIDPADEDGSVERIFRYVDYGHQSIGDMAPVAIFMDGVTIGLAYLLWAACPTASGQESSTRYIKLQDLPEPANLGIPQEHVREWADLMARGFSAYHRALLLWEGLGTERPQLTRIPESLLEEAKTSEAAQKKLDRMRRNYAFDRARVFLPVAGLTNVMMVMPATGWVRLCSLLLSHHLPEAVHLGKLVRDQLNLVIPHLTKHARPNEGLTWGLADELVRAAAAVPPGDAGAVTMVGHEVPCVASLDVSVPSDVAPATDFPRALSHHQTRYDYIGSALQRTAVRYSWSAMGLAEIRDLNRHRTGTKYCPLVPQGFHAALDEVPPDQRGSSMFQELLTMQDDLGRRSLDFTRKALRRLVPTGIYGHLLGTQLRFEHTTTADKFIYEAELRTGTGTHYRYCAHERDMLRLWFTRFPETRGLILEGSAEPE